MLGADFPGQPPARESAAQHIARLNHEHWVKRIAFLAYLHRSGRIGGPWDGGARYPEHLDPDGMAG